MVLNDLDVPEYAIDLIKHFEGLRLKAYQDSVGVWTIGYGHTGSAHKGMVITRQKAHKLLLSDIQVHAAWVKRLVNVSLEDYEFGALASFCFNLGPGSLQRSTLRAKLNRGDKIEASNEFWKWRRAGGVILPGLVRRRDAEKQMFLGFV